MWHKTDEKLPRYGKFVLARYSGEAWDDADPNVVCVVARRVKLGKDDDFPYEWETFGCDTFVPDDITHWMPLPKAPRK